MRRLFIACGVLLAILAGCQSVPPPRAAAPVAAVVQATHFDPAAAVPAEPKLLGDDLPATSLPQPKKEELPSPLPAAESQPLSLVDAASLALAQNPDLLAARQAEGVSLGALGVAQTYPFNPWVQIQVTPDPRNHDGTIGSTAHYVLLMQTLQLAHQRQHREAAAQSVLNGTRWNIVQAELQAVAQTERLFFTALYQQGVRDIARANADLSRELLNISEKQLEGGQLSKSDVAIVRLDEASARRRAELAEANYQTALLDLRRQLNIPLSLPLILRGSLADLQFGPALAALAPEADQWEPPSTDPEEVASRIAAARPDVLAAHSDFDAARANLNLAHANRVPDLQIGPYYQHTDSGTAAWGFRAQSDVPVLNSGQPLVRQRMAEVNQRQMVWEQLHARAALEAQTAIDRYERARRLATASAATGSELPEELARLETQFKAGEIDVLRIVTARTSLLAARQAHLDTLNELAQSAAALTAATGLTPEAIAIPR